MLYIEHSSCLCSNSFKLFNIKYSVTFESLQIFPFTEPVKKIDIFAGLDARKDGCSERWMLKSSLKKSYSATYIPLFFWFSLLYFYHVRIHRKVQKGYFKLLKLERPCTASQSIFLPRHISEICK